MAPFFKSVFIARFVLAWTVLCGFADGARGGEAASEYSVKAAFLYNFAQFVQWPSNAFASNSDPIVLGVFGDGNFPADLQALDGKTVPAHGQRRTIVLKHMSSPREIDHCQILFVLHDESSLLPEIIREVDSRNILTVIEDSEDLDRAGAVINLFKTQEKRIRFEIDVAAAKRAGLKIDSPLLNLAKLAREH